MARNKETTHGLKSFWPFGGGKKIVPKIPDVEIKQPNAYGYYKMTCPFCLEEFDVWEMPFRAETEQAADVNVGGANQEYGQPGPQAGGRRGLDNDDLYDDLYDDEDGLDLDSPDPMYQDQSQESFTEGGSGVLHAFPLEEDDLKREFCRKFQVHNGKSMLGKVLHLFKTDGSFCGSGIHKARLWGEKTWIPVSSDAATVGALRHKAVAEILDQYGNTSSERLCPHCHNVMPAEAGQLPCYVIMFLGDTNSGKTVYKIRLLNELDRGGLLNGSIRVGKFYSRSASGGEEASSIRALWEKTFARARSGEDNEIHGATNRTYIDPLTVTLDRNRKSVALLTLYDFPGESIRISSADQTARAYMTQSKQRIEKTDGIMFLLDSTTLGLMENLPNEYRTRAKKTADGRELTETKEVWDPHQVLSHFVNNYLAADDGAQIKPPTCFMFSKSDLLQMAIKECRDDLDPWRNVQQIRNALSSLQDPPSCVTNWEDIQRRRAEAELYRQSGGNPTAIMTLDKQVEQRIRQHTLVDLDDIFQSHQELAALLPDEVDCAVRYADKGLCFAVSAVGQPISTNDTSVASAPALRVMEPLEYLLWQMGLAEGMEPENEENKQWAITLRTRA